MQVIATYLHHGKCQCNNNVDDNNVAAVISINIEYLNKLEK